MCVLHPYSHVLHGSHGVTCMNEPVTVLCGGAIVDNSHAIIRCVSTHIYHLFKVSTRNREMWAARTMRSSYFVPRLATTFFCLYLFLIRKMSLKTA